MDHTIAGLLGWARRQLHESESAGLDARLLLSHSLGQSLTYLHTWPEKPVVQPVVDQFTALVQARKAGQPVAYLLGYRDFWSLRLKVSPATLIPRPETELLVETCLELPLGEHSRVLDMGTGTGAIALALASERAHWTLTGSDKVEAAVLLARENAQINQLNNVTFCTSDWFSALGGQQFDLIVSNPPYVETDSPYLSQGDVRFEPRSALTSGIDGLDDIRLIIKASFEHLADRGYLVFEHGFSQADAITQLLREKGFSGIKSFKDFNGLHRVTLGCKSR